MRALASRLVWRLARYGVLLLFVAAAAWVACVNGSVNDEYAAHVTAGYLYWKTGRFAGGVFNPPLGQLWVAWPLVVGNVPLFPFSDAAPVLARVANVLLATVFLGTVGGWVARRTNEQGALAATASLAAFPEFLAHASLATLELPIAVLIAWTTLGWIEAVRRPSLRLWLGTGLGLGAALATKITSLLLFPMGAAITLVGLSRWRRLRRRLWGRGFGQLLMISVAWRALTLLGAAWLVILTAYGFRWQQGANSCVTQIPSVARFFLPAEFLDQFIGKAVYASGGNLAYFAGQQKLGGWWWYYPVVFILKTPLPLLLLWGWSLIAAMRAGPYRARSLAWAALTFALCASFNRAQIGVRHLLPLAPLLAVLVGWLVVSPRRAVRVAAWALTAGAVINSACYLPYPLAAESVLLAGRGWRFFTDANIDWGQANAEIRKLIERGYVREPRPYVAESGKFVVRVNHLWGFRAPTREGFSWLRKQAPEHKVAGGGLIFDVQETLAATTPSAPTAKLAWLLGHVARSRPSITVSTETLASAPLAWGSVAREVEDSLELIDPSVREEAAAAWIRVVEETETSLEAYELLRRLTRLWPQLTVAREAEKRVRLVIEAERLARAAPARSAFARANAAWLAGDARETIRWLRSALIGGAPNEPCAELGYQAACALGWWPAAVHLAEKLPQQRQRALQPPLGLVRKCHRGRLSADLFPLATWCYQQRAWPTAASLLIGILNHDPSHAQAFNLLGEMVVRYKEQTLGLTESDRTALEQLAITGALEFH